MTIGIAAMCDQGAICLTDSMNNVTAELGGYIAKPASRSFHRVPAVGAVAVVSGNLMRPLSEIDEFCLTLETPTIEAAARQLYDLCERDDMLLRATWPQYEALKLGTGGTPQVLIVGGRDRDSLRVGALTPRTVQWVSWPEKAFAAVGGAWVAYLAALGLVEQQPPRPTLEACVSLVSTWARGYVSSVYAGRSLEQMQREGINPTVGFPLHAITFDVTGTIREYEITESESFEVEVVSE